MKGISVKTKPSKLTYSLDDMLDTDGLVLTVTYSDGTKTDITKGYTFSPEQLTVPGKQTVTLTYGGMSTDFVVEVEEVKATLSVLTPPTKTVYTVNEELDVSGLVLEVVYSGSVSTTIRDGYTVEPVKLDKVGTHKITVNYDGMSTWFEVEVKKAGTSAKGDIKDTDLKWSLEHGELTVSGDGTMKDFAEGEAPWQKYADEIDSVVIENGVTSIGANAFVGISMQKLYIGVDVGVKNVSAKAVYNCNQLETITVAKNSRGLIAVNNVLYSNDQTKLLIYPTGSAQTVYKIPASVVEIGGYMTFAGSNLEQIVINKSLFKIEPTAFYGAQKLTHFTCEAGNTAFATEGGVLYIGSKSTLICYPAAKEGSSFEIEHGIKYINPYAFAYNRSLTTITVSETVQEIYDYAFMEAKRLTTVNYKGTQADFNAIEIGEGNEPFKKAEIIFE